MDTFENQQQRLVTVDVSNNRVSIEIESPKKRKTFPTSNNEYSAKKPRQCLDLKDIQTTAGGLKFTQHGTIFQLDLLTLTLYRANHHGYQDFGLATEIPDAEKFDDIVFVRKKDEGQKARLIQAKHSEGQIKDISQSDLSSKNSKAPFGMLKYFESYLKIEENCKNCKSKLYNCEIEDVMILTNRSISNDLQEHVKGATMQDDNLLYTSRHVHDKARKYSIQKGQFYEDLTKIFIERYKDIKKHKDKGNEEAKDIESQAENVVDEFFNKFRLVVDYPNRAELKTMLKDELQEEYKILDSRAKLDILRMEMYEWLSDRTARDLTYKSASELFARIDEKISCYEIYGITKSNLESIPDQYHFQNDDLLEQLKQFLNSELILLVLEFDTLGLGRIRTAQTFKKLKQLENDKRHSENDGQHSENDEPRSKNLKSYIYQFGHIFINSEQSQNRDFYEYLKKRLPDKGKWNLIIVELDDIQKDLYSSVIEHITELDKKVILIISNKRKKMLPSQIQQNISKIQTNFMHLKPDSQKRLFETETALFQKTIQPLNKLIFQQNKNVIDATALDRFIYRKDVRIGKPFAYKSYNESTYIERYLNLKICIQERIKKELFRASSFIKDIFHFPFQPNKDNINDIIVISNLPEDFEDAAESIECENIHWLKDIDGKLVWTRTKGNVSKLAEYRVSDTGTQVKNSIIDESSLIESTDKIVIISGQHGTGKSTLCGSLEKKLKQTNCLIWTIRIDLQNYSSFLIDKHNEILISGTNAQISGIDLLIELLQSNNSSNRFTPLEAALFRSVLETTEENSDDIGKVVVALFIDEISEVDSICRKLVLDMLVGLKSTAVYRIFILTRPTTRSMLEVKLGTFAYNFEPFSDSNNIEFFEKRQLDKKNIDKRCNYTPLCMEIISKINDISLTTEYSNDLFDLFEILQSAEDKSSDMQKEFERIFKKYFSTDDITQDNFDINTLQSEVLSSTTKVDDNLITAFKDYLVVKFLGDCLLNSNFNKVLFDIFEEILQNMEYTLIRSLMNSWWKKYNSQVPSDSLEKLTDHFKSIEDNLRRKISCTILEEGHCEILKLLPNPDLSTTELTVDVVQTLIDLKSNCDVNALFLKAAESGNVVVCEWFLNAEIVNLNSKLNDNQTVAEAASKIYDIDILKMLESKGVTEITLDDPDQLLELFVEVAKFGNEENFKWLLKHGLKIDTTSVNGSSLLHKAAEFAPNKFFHWLLLENDAKHLIDIKNCNDFTPLHVAIANNNVPVIEILIENGAELVDNNGYTTLHHAAKYGNRETCLHILGFYPDVDPKEKTGKTPLLIASLENNLEAVKLLVEKNADLSVADENGWTVLHFAVEGGNRKTILYVLDLCKNINVRTKLGRTPLHLAVRKNNIEIVEVLMEKNADVSIADEDGGTILHFAAAWGNQETILYVSDFYKDINVRDKLGRTPLHVALVDNNLESTKVLIEKNGDVSIADEKRWTILHFAAACGTRKTILYVLDFCKDINVRDKLGRTPLHLAVGHKNLETVEVLIKKNADVSIANEKRWTILHFAAAYGNRETIIYVLDFCKDINVREKSGRTPLHLAVAKNNLETAKVLIRNNADVSVADEKQWTILHFAAAWGNRELILYVFDFCKDINVRTKSGRTPLHCAVEKNNLENAKVLIEKNVDVSLADENGWTILHFAAELGNRTSILYVLDFCKDINVREKLGRTPLHVALLKNNLETAKVLIEKNAEVSIPDVEGLTILHFATAWGNQETISYVLDFCEDINVRTKSGRTPLHCAVEKNNLEAAKVLIEKNADVNIAEDGGLTILHFAAAWGNRETILYVLDFCKDINVSEKLGRTPLHCAVEKNNLKTAEALIENNANVSLADEKQWTVLHFAAACGTRKTLLYVLDFCNDINVREKLGRTPLHLAVGHKNLETAEVLIEKNADVSIANEKRWVILHFAAAYGNRKTILYVLDFCRDINVREKLGRTPLHLAVAKNNLETAKVLIRNNADVSVADEKQWTILHFAAAWGNRKLILYVFNFCKDINVRTKSGRTPLHCAVEKNNLENAKVLIEKNADVSLADDDGWTILHFAAEMGNRATILYVLDFCNDINVREKLGRTPLHLAVEVNNLEAAEILIEENADIRIADENGETIWHMVVKQDNFEMCLKLLDCINIRDKNMLFECITYATSLAHQQNRNQMKQILLNYVSERTG